MPFRVATSNNSTRAIARALWTKKSQTAVDRCGPPLVAVTAGTALLIIANVVSPQFGFLDRALLIQQTFHCVVVQLRTPDNIGLGFDFVSHVARSGLGYICAHLLKRRMCPSPLGLTKARRDNTYYRSLYRNVPGTTGTRYGNEYPAHAACDSSTCFQPSLC